MACYRDGGCGPYEMRSCSECPASKPDYAKRYDRPEVPTEKAQVEPQFHLEFRFLNHRPVSVNDAYIPTARKRKKGGGGFGGAFLRKSFDLIQWQEMVKKTFDEEFFYSKSSIALIAEWINNMNIGAKLILKISMPEEEYWNLEHELHRNDASNFIKAIEDSIFSNIGIDDTRTIRLEVEKGYNEDGVWYVEAHLTDTSIDNKINAETRRAYFDGE